MYSYFPDFLGQKFIKNNFLLAQPHKKGLKFSLTSQLFHMVLSKETLEKY